VEAIRALAVEGGGTGRRNVRVQLARGSISSPERMDRAEALSIGVAVTAVNRMDG
jgi:hypothetical protein